MGNFSREPLDVLNASLAKGYIGLHIEQGVPVLDRDLNLLNDLISATVRAVISRYIGDGVADESAGFAIEAIPADNDFRIAGPGTCLVGGIQVAIDVPKNYSEQIGIPALTTPSTDRTDTVYLDVWLAEVDGTTDPALLNSADVGMQTSVRQKPCWVVRVAEGGEPPAPGSGHTHYQLARLTRSHGDEQITSDMIINLRQTRLNLANVEGRLRVVEGRLREVERKLQLPILEQFSPKGGPPGHEVTLRGQNFNIGTPQPQVAFGTVKAKLVGTPTDTKITAQVPKMTGGNVKISVTTEVGRVVSDGDFTVLPLPSFKPSPNQFEPKEGPPGQEVTLRGQNFIIGTLQVAFGSVTAELVGTPTGTRIIAQVPKMTDGDVKITVTTSVGSVVSDDTFTVLKPPPPSFTPPEFRPVEGRSGDSVILHGKHFDVQPVSVQFGTKKAKVVSCSAEQIITEVPSGMSGDVSIAVITGGGKVTSTRRFKIKTIF